MNRLILIWFVFTINTSLTGQCLCDPLPNLTVETEDVSNVSELISAMNQANTSNGNVKIVLAAGTYQLTANLPFISSNMVNLSVVGATGDFNDVIIKGQGWDDNSVTHIFNVTADNFTVAHMTIGEVYYHPIQVHSNPNDADNFLAHNVRFVDAKEQLLKVSGGGDLFADNGRVECCEFEFTGGIAYQWYTGGIDAHRSKDWVVYNNVFKHIRSPASNLAEHAIHFWRESNGTVVDANQIINCDRGIGFGLGSDVESGHAGGLIMNNFVHCSRDVGIGLESASDAKVYNNTVIVENYFNAIEYRFPTTTNADIFNNIVNEAISDRSSGSTGTLMTNYTVSDMSMFVDPGNYNYHLQSNPMDIVDAGTYLSEVASDYDCESRGLNNSLDIGADEVGNTTSDAYLLAESITLYPNPVENEFSIGGLLGEFNIKILDHLGQVHETINQTTGTVRIQIADLPAGIYLVMVEHAANQSVSLVQILKL